MIQLTLRYANGEMETYDIRTKIPAGGCIAQLESISRTKIIGTVESQLCIDGLK